MKKWFVKVFNHGNLQGEGGGEEDILVLHLVVGAEHAGGTLGEVLEGPISQEGRLPPLHALEVRHQGVQEGLVGSPGHALGRGARLSLDLRGVA